MKMKAATNKIIIVSLCIVLIFCAAFGVKPIGKAIYPREYTEFVSYYANKYTLDENMVYAFMRTESHFNPDANSGDADARGLMQITEETFAWIKSNIAPTEDITFDEMYEPEQSIRFACFMLKYCMITFDNDVATTAAAYHNGITFVKNLVKDERYSQDGKTLSVFPYRQMNIYVRRVETAYNMYEKIYS